MTIQDDLTGDTIPIDVDDADYSDEAVSSLLSLCKLIRKNWKFNLELGSLYAYAPNAHQTCFPCTRVNKAKSTGNASGAYKAEDVDEEDAIANWTPSDYLSVPVLGELLALCENESLMSAFALKQADYDFVRCLTCHFPALQIRLENCKRSS